MLKSEALNLFVRYRVEKNIYVYVYIHKIYKYSYIFDK